MLKADDLKCRKGEQFSTEISNVLEEYEVLTALQHLNDLITQRIPDASFCVVVVDAQAKLLRTQHYMTGSVDLIVEGINQVFEGGVENG